MMPIVHVHQTYYWGSKTSTLALEGRCIEAEAVSYLGFCSQLGEEWLDRL